MRRSVTDPSGVPWVVALEWEGQRAREAVGQIGPRVRAARERSTRKQLDREQAAARARDQGKADESKRRNPLDALDVLDPFDVFDAGPLALVVIGVLLLILFLLFGLPLLIALLAGVLELTLLVAIAAGAFLVRTLRRRPWRVTATAADGRRHAWDQVGWRPSRALVREIAAAVASGLPPTSVAGDRLRVLG